MNKEEIRQLFRDNQTKTEGRQELKEKLDSYLTKIKEVLNDTTMIYKPRIIKKHNLNPFNHQPLHFGPTEKMLPLMHFINQKLLECARNHEDTFSLDAVEVYNHLYDNEHTIAEYVSKALDRGVTIDNVDHLDAFNNSVYRAVANYLNNCGHTGQEVYWEVNPSLYSSDTFYFEDSSDTFYFEVGSYYLE